MTMRDSKRVADALQAVRDAKNELAAYKAQQTFEHDRSRVEIDKELAKLKTDVVELTFKYADQVRKNVELRALVKAQLPFLWRAFE